MLSFLSAFCGHVLPVNSVQASLLGPLSSLFSPTSFSICLPRASPGDGGKKLNSASHLYTLRVLSCSLNFVGNITRKPPFFLLVKSHFVLCGMSIEGRIVECNGGWGRGAKPRTRLQQFSRLQNKGPQTGGLRATELWSLTVLEVGSPRPNVSRAMFSETCRETLPLPLPASGLVGHHWPALSCSSSPSIPALSSHGVLA